MRRVGVLVLLAGVAMVVARAEAPARSFEKTVAPFLAEYCAGCHTGKKAKGELDLSRFADAKAVLNERAVWEKVRRKLIRREMPPEEAEPPSDKEYAAVLKWIDKKLGPPKRARVTMRRLNRVEYENTIRDLLGVDYDAGENFPADDVGYGFDNIGDVLSMPPILMEKYLDAAEAIAALAVLDEDPENPPAHKIDAPSLKIAGSGKHLDRGVAHLYSNGEVYGTFHFPRDGEYILRASAFGQQAGPEVVRAAFRIDGKNLKTVLVPAEEAAPGTYHVRAQVKKGTRRFGVAFINDYYRPQNVDPTNRDRNFGLLHLEVVGPVDRPVLPASHRRLIPEKAPALKEIVRRTAARAWRRPVSDAEVARLLRTVESAAPDGATLERRVRLALVAMLVSPRFLFRAELGSPRLTDFELASRLSYFLWSSMPDDELFALAREGILKQDDVLAGQVRRMLRDARASALSRHFALQWLKVKSLDEATPDPIRFPEVDAALRDAMRAETELFFEAILREDRSLWELLDADFTFVNGPLAQHYGLAGVRGERMRRVKLTDGRRGGVLTQASVLLMTSNPTRSSPVKRGKWILETLLDDPPPPPPPGADNLDPSPEAVRGKTLRERLEQHRKDPKCAACHTRMDTLGFGLEHYDAVGRWRDRDGDLEIDSVGTLPDGRRFEGAAGLRRILRADPKFPRSLSKHMLTYALGRGVTDADEAALRALVATLEKEPKLSRLIVEICKLDAFRLRAKED